MKNMIIAHNGSVQNVPGIPDDFKAIYKTFWEIAQKKVLNLATDRGAYIYQLQSLNVHLQAPTLSQLTSMHFYGWKKGLKTGMYYLRTRPVVQAIQFTVDPSVLKDAKTANTKAASAVVEKKNRASRVLLVLCLCCRLPLSEFLSESVPLLLLSRNPSHRSFGHTPTYQQWSRLSSTQRRLARASHRFLVSR
jgi:ribonucleotide reductase alpha subunit